MIIITRFAKRGEWRPLEFIPLSRDDEYLVACVVVLGGCGPEYRVASRAVIHYQGILSDGAFSFAGIYRFPTFLPIP